MKKLMALAVLCLFFTSCTTIEYTRQKDKADELYRNGVISKQEYTARVISATREVMSHAGAILRGATANGRLRWREEPSRPL